MTTFTGFGEGALTFYEGLAADNSRTYWQTHVDTYRREIAEPLAALAAALEPEFGAIKIFRPHRDVRFSPDKRPYQEHASLAAPAGETRPVIGGLYLALSPTGLFVGGRIPPPGARPTRAVPPAPGRRRRSRSP